MTNVKEIRGILPLKTPTATLVWRRKHGRGTWLKPAERSVWTLSSLGVR